ncbi:hypothetical protein ACOSP7_022517 [Xanthoceras sorbifolium]
MDTAGAHRCSSCSCDGAGALWILMEQTNEEADPMAAIFQGLGAVTALSPSNCFDSNKLHHPSRRSLSGRKASFFVVRSDGSVNFASNSRGHKAKQLITNAVAALSSFFFFGY